MNSLRSWLLAVALASLFCFSGLGNHPLAAPDEPRVAGIAWVMQHEGRWWVPYLGDAPFLEQPPLHYALVGVCIRHLGASEGVARLPGAVASLLTALLVYSLARRLAGSTAALCALLALVGTGGFYRYSHSALVDPLLVLFVMCAYYAYVRSVWDRAAAGGDGGPEARAHDAPVSPAWLAGVYLAAALAYWVKGFVGIVAVGGPIAIDVLVGRRWRALLSPVHLVGIPFLCAACAAWPLVLHWKEGDAAVRSFLLQNGLYRALPGAASPGSYSGGHVKPFWYYLERAPGQIGWILVFVPATAAWLLRDDRARQRSRSALRFLGAVFPIGTLLLSIPGTKRGLYLLPFEPPLAVAIGAWMGAAARGAAGSRVERGVIRLCAELSGRLLRPLSRFASFGTDPARGPLRLAAIAFVLSLAWNLFAYPFTDHDRDLGPMAREVGARVGAEPLVGLQLQESLRGALSFYAGLIASHVEAPDELSPRLAQLRSRDLLAPLGLRRQIETALGHPVAIEQSWVVKRGEYALFAVTEP